MGVQGTVAGSPASLWRFRDGGGELPSGSPDLNGFLGDRRPQDLLAGDLALVIAAAKDELAGVRHGGPFVVTFCRNIWSVFSRFPVFSGHEIRIPGNSEMRLIILKRKELTDRPRKTWESSGTVGQLTLDQHMEVRILRGQPFDNK